MFQTVSTTQATGALILFKVEKRKKEMTSLEIETTLHKNQLMRQIQITTIEEGILHQDMAPQNVDRRMIKIVRLHVMSEVKMGIDRIHQTKMNKKRTVEVVGVTGTRIELRPLRVLRVITRRGKEANRMKRLEMMIKTDGEESIRTRRIGETVKLRVSLLSHTYYLYNNGYM